VVVVTSEVGAVLLAASAFLAARGWCRGCGARDAQGSPVAYDAETAVAWCAMGAIYRVAVRSSVGDDAVRVVDRHLGATSTTVLRAIERVEDWNDAPDRTAAEVVAVLAAAGTAHG
jgi:hypothetical protein